MTNRRPTWPMLLIGAALLVIACADDAAPPSGDGVRAAGRGDAGTTPPVAPEPPVPEIAAIAEAMVRALQAYGADARVETDGATLTVSRRTREFMVYERGPDGAWATELTPMIGPEHDGLMFTATIHDGLYTSDLPRERQLMESRPNNYVLGRAERGPYAITYRSMSSLDLVDKHVRCTFVIGQQTEVRMVQAIHRAVLDECARRKWLSIPPGWPLGP